MNALQLRDTQPTNYAIIKEQKVDPMWSADEDERRAAIIKKSCRWSEGSATLQVTRAVRAA